VQRARKTSFPQLWKKRQQASLNHNQQLHLHNEVWRWSVMGGVIMWWKIIKKLETDLEEWTCERITIYRLTDKRMRPFSRKNRILLFRSCWPPFVYMIKHAESKFICGQLACNCCWISVLTELPVHTVLLDFLFILYYSLIHHCQDTMFSMLY